MGCFKEIYTEQMDSSNNSQNVLFMFESSVAEHPMPPLEFVKIELMENEDLLAFEKDEFSLHLFGRLEDPLARSLSLSLLS